MASIPEEPATIEQLTATESPSDVEVISKLKEYLSGNEMSLDVTERQLRAKLEDHFGTTLKDRKALIRAEVMEWLSRQEAGDGEQEEEKVTPKKTKKRKGGTMILSEPLEAFFDFQETPTTRFGVVKGLWAYIKAHNLSDKRNILLDDKMRTVFHPPLNMFSMNKQLTKHIFYGEPGDDEPTGSKRQRNSEAGEPKKRRKTKQKASDKKGKSRAGFSSTLLKVTDEMAAFLGTHEPLSRAQITKQFWAYVKEHGLQDPACKSEIIADDTLRKLTGKERFRGFSFAKTIEEHAVETIKASSLPQKQHEDEDGDEDDAEESSKEEDEISAQEGEGIKEEVEEESKIKSEAQS